MTLMSSISIAVARQATTIVSVRLVWSAWLISGSGRTSSIHHARYSRHVTGERRGRKERPSGRRRPGDDVSRRGPGRPRAGLALPGGVRRGFRNRVPLRPGGLAAAGDARVRGISGRLARLARALGHLPYDSRGPAGRG